MGESEQVLSNVKKQVLATLICNIYIFIHGASVGWVSPALPVLLSNDTPLVTGPITTEQLSWIGSMSNFGSTCGTFIFGALSVLLGAKRCMYIVAIPQIIFWLLILYGNTYHHILLGLFCFCYFIIKAYFISFLIYCVPGRFSSGLSAGGIQTGVVLFVAEISNNK